MRVAIAILMLWLPALVAAQETGEPPAAEPGASGEPEGAPALDLDRLLRVPVGASAPSQMRGGRDRRAWSQAFSEARAEVRDLEARIELAQQTLRETAPENWGFTPSGGAMPTDPEVLKLRAQLKRDRRSLETARQRLRELEVEASLAGVPDEWRVSPEPPAP